jgi:hypothetical protein
MGRIEILSLEQYANIVGTPICNTVVEVQNYASEHFGVTLFDYPVEELEYVITEVNESLCLVKTEYGLRICEI